MISGLLSDPDRKEGLSLVYVKALTARAGFLTSTPGPDRDSIDLRVRRAVHVARLSICNSRLPPVSSCRKTASCRFDCP